MADKASEAQRSWLKPREECSKQSEGRQRGGWGCEVGLTTAGGSQPDLIGQREFHEGGYGAGVELAGLPDQALGCIWEIEAFDFLFWKDLDGVFTCGLRAEKEAGASQLWCCLPFSVPGHLSPSGPFFSLFSNPAQSLSLQGPSLTQQSRLKDSLAHQEKVPGGSSL